jgi:hypothetical protein
MNSGVEIFATGGHLFSKVEPGAKVADGLMALTDRIQRRRFKQPGGESILAHPSARDGEELEEAALPEEVEIGRVEVIGDVKAVSPLAKALPAIFHTRKTSIVEIDRTLGNDLLTQDLRMVNGNRDEEESRECNPDQGKAMGMKIDPKYGDLCQNEEKTKISKTDVNLFKIRNLKLASVPSVQVRLRWRGGL